MLNKVNINGRIVYYLGSRFFNIKGIAFEVISSTLTGSGAYDGIHTIKNRKNGKMSDIQISRIIDILSTHEANNHDKTQTPPAGVY